MKYLKLTGVCTALAVISWLILIFAEPMGFYGQLTVIAIALSITAICFFALFACKKIWKDASPYRLFAIVTGVFGAGTLAYAIYDIMTDTGWFAGLLGALIIIFTMPIFAILLIADLVLWLNHRKKAKAAQTCAPKIEATDEDKDK